MAVDHKKILIVAPAWVGDMVMAQTLFRFLSRQYPGCIIDVVSPKSTVALVERMPEVRRGIPLPIGHGEFGFLKRLKLGRSLRQEQYDQAFVLPNSWKSALIPFFAGIKKRTAWRGEWRYGLLNDVRLLDKEKLPLMIERFLALGLAKEDAMPADLAGLQAALSFPRDEKNRLTSSQKSLLPNFSVKAADQEAALKKHGMTKSGQKILALCPGAAFGPSKRWPPEYFAEIAKQKLAEGCQVWIFGAPSDAEAAETIQTMTDQACVNLVGKTNLSEAIDLLALVDVVVSNDSGLMHIACALSKPVVAVYGSTSPKFTPPLSDRVKMIWLKLDCSPCFKRECPLGHWDCMKKLTPNLVLSVLDDMTGRAKPAGLDQ